MTRLTFDQGTYDAPVWSPDGRYIVFSGFGRGLQSARTDDAGRPQILVESKAILDPAAFGPVGRFCPINEIMGGNTQIWTVPVEDAGSQLKAGKAEPFQEGGFRGADGISPDGRWLAYSSSEGREAVEGFLISIAVCGANFRVAIRSEPALFSGLRATGQVT